MFFKGTERRPTARDISAEIDGIGGEFNAFTGKELTAYYVKCAADSAPVAIDVLSDMLLALALRRRRDRAREGRDLRGDQHVPRHAARPDRPGARRPALRRHAARPADHRHEGDRRAPPRARRSCDYLGTWYRPERMVIGLGGAVTDAMVDDVAARFGGLEAVRDAGAARDRCCRIERPHRAHRAPRLRPGAPHPERRRLPGRPPRPLRAGGAAGRARRRHVVAPLHRGARAPRPRLLRVRVARGLHRHRLAVRAGRRRHRSASSSRSRRSGASCAGWRPSPCPPTRSRRRKRYITGRTVLGVEDAARA